MYVKRNIEDKITKYIHTPEIIAVVGPRQSGKTTLVSKIHDNYKGKSSFLSFEDPDLLSMFERNTGDFVNLYVKDKNALFIDEFQYAKNGGKILKYIYDRYKIKIFITGSSSIDLTVKALRYLVGRIFTFELMPFDFEEFLRARDNSLCGFYVKYVKLELKQLLKTKRLNFDSGINEKLKKYFKEYAVYGGYPRVVLSSSREEKKQVLKGIYSTFFLREVRDYLGLIDDYKLQVLIKALSLQAGSLIEYKELSSISGYSFLLLKKYLNFLQKSYVCSLVRPFFKNKRKEIVKNPKAYFLDSGLRNYLAGDFRDLDKRTDSGQLLENAIFTNLIKKGYSLKYWRDKKKREVDFVIEDESLKIAFESEFNLSKCRRSFSGAGFLEEHPEFNLSFLYFRGFDSKIKDETGQRRFPCFMI